MEFIFVEPKLRLRGQNLWHLLVILSGLLSLFDNHIYTIGICVLSISYLAKG